MATVYFYEKPGCINNTRQKKLLAEAGHQVVALNLLTEPWQAERLRAFFGELAVRDWFNVSAPAIKQGEIDPGKLTEQQALTLMLENPLLIRRPLMQVGNSLMAGFDQQAVDSWIGLKAAESDQDLESCPRPLAQASCGHE
ncbi:MAG: nitrogenase-associated protein [Methylobacter tundripaludum]|uniref:Nitrogenase-associated protein n=1 Tax=Methylobacter tundripaludum TaxID=173365 RepID=A0A2S6GXR4_9GAMM|nr:ArsC/Spx/MgsR family protein [Methylobacter tundripaludum]MCK9637619.1 nitrogenase-associated protein [Methylobacter tundripaludum]PPK70009.1 nitrogenase-associated protein [Methylobacter tundripaludum]